MKYTKYLKSLMNCPFCNISKGEIIKQNKYAMLILARAPYHKDHLLVVPKKHALNFSDLNKKELESIFELVTFGEKKLYKIYKNLSILYREGDKEKIGKSIDHFHFNLIPDEMIGSVSINSKDRDVLDSEKYFNLTKEAKRRFK